MEEIETLLLGALLYNSNFLTKTIAYFDEVLFADNKHKVIFNKLNDFYREFSTQPDYASLYYDVTSTPDLTTKELNEIEEVLNIIKDLKLPSDEWLYTRAEEFIQKKRIEIALIKSVEIYHGENKKETIDAVPEILREAVAVSFDNKVGMSFLKDAEARYDYYTNPEYKIPCGLTDIDNRTGGGFTSKTLNAFMGATGVGKTLSLCSLAASYAKEGYDVLYISLEMKEEEINKRIDANLLDINMSDLGKVEKSKYLSSIVKLREKHYGDILVKQFSPNTCNINHIRKVIHDMKIQDKITPKILIVDYMSIMASAIYNKNSVKLHEYLKSISEELRGLCIEQDVIGWTALQTNRSGVDSTELGLDKVASSYDITHGLDYLMAIWRTPEGDQDGVMFMKEEKSRYGNRLECPVLPIGVDLYKQRLFDCSRTNIKSLKETRNIDEIRSNTKDKIQSKFKKVNALT